MSQRIVPLISWIAIASAAIAVLLFHLFDDGLLTAESALLLQLPGIPAWWLIRYRRAPGAAADAATQTGRRFAILLSALVVVVGMMVHLRRGSHFCATAHTIFVLGVLSVDVA